MVGSIPGEMNEFKIGICSFSPKQTTVQVKNNDKFDRSQEYVS
jgi:hypothetical protein